jgi:hypothetical protein
VSRGLTPHVAWRVSFVTVPFVIVVTVGLLILFFAPDTPFGKWEDRHINRALAGTTTPPNDAKVVDISSYTMDQPNQVESVPHLTPESIYLITAVHLFRKQPRFKKQKTLHVRHPRCLLCPSRDDRNPDPQRYRQNILYHANSPLLCLLLLYLRWRVSDQLQLIFVLY